MAYPIQFQRDLGNCFRLFISADPVADMREAVKNSMIIDRAIKCMLSGSITPSELLEMVEPVIALDNMDDYLDEIELGLEDFISD